MTPLLTESEIITQQSQTQSAVAAVLKLFHLFGRECHDFLLDLIYFDR